MTQTEHRRNTGSGSEFDAAVAHLPTSGLRTAFTPVHWRWPTARSPIRPRRWFVAVSNAVRHAKASTLTVRVKSTTTCASG